jgi:hypothetical protein
MKEFPSGRGFGVMPSRLMSLLILVYWSIAAFCLLKWDVLPEMSVGYPPDLRGIAFASDSNRPARWSILVVEGPSEENHRTVGEAVTTSIRQHDGWFEMASNVDFDAGDLLRGTVLAVRQSLPVQVKSRYHVDPLGNLQNFDLRVASKDIGDELVHVTGKLHQGKMEIVSRGPVPILNRSLSIKYEPRSVVSDILGPLDRLPGLHEGQRWETEVINPFTGQVEHVRVEVTRRTVIHWAGNLETAYEVEQKVSGLRMRTWVRYDGVILRQEVPFPFVHLILERRAEDASKMSPGDSATTTGRPAA